MGRWLFSGGNLDASHAHHKTHPWYMVLWLTGVDYFSTLGYQPGIALLAAGAISPVATLLLIVVTLLCALPVYAQVAARSYAGQGSIAMLENLLTGWWSKIFVLILIGFAATDFIITMTLSAADAAQHAIENPLLHHYLEGHQVIITIALLALLAIVFIKGFAEALGLAATIAIPYLLLNAIVLARGFIEIFSHPELLSNWQSALWTHPKVSGSLPALLALTAFTFPKLALGLSGFETGVSVMPLVSGGTSKTEHEGELDGSGNPPWGRIKNTRKLLTAAALIMSVLLICSSFVTTLLIKEEDYRAGGKAAGRAIAFLAHEYLGNIFGSIYDFSTILILWFAGASAMAGLLNLIPRYLPRFGMAPRWTAYRRPLVMVLFAISVIVTIIFKANVEAQGGAYATGVLALMLSAAVAVAIALRRDDPRTGTAPNKMLSNYFWVVAAVFAFTFVDNVIERHDGIIISGVFILFVIVVSALSRYQRATELRVAQFQFVDEESKRIWPQIVNKKVNLVPLRTSTPEHRAFKEKEIRKHYNVQGPIAFVHVTFMDNRSEFLAPLTVRVFPENDDYVIEVHGAIAIANTIAYISELIDPISIFVGLTRQNLMGQSLKYLLFGEGETGMMIYKILLRYWEWTPEDDVRPLIFLMSE
ncbi:MAG TPA: hypothetical protein VFZ34_01735 [Blastocatellia bacterium]|nr:hypothetical protein [Blastocatellia bacterium]